MADPQAQPEPIAVDAAGAAAMVGMSRSSWYSAVAGGLAPVGFRIGRAHRWSIAELTAWVAAGAPPVSVWTARQASASTRARLHKLTERKSA